MAKSLIEIREATKIYFEPNREVEAVKNLSLDVREGEIFGLLGPNGAGKTTTLRMISTVLNPTEGEIFVNGINTQEEPGKVRRTLGFLSGETGLYDKLTAREMVEFFGKLYGIRENELKERTDNLFSLLNMEEFSSTRCEALSSGTKQKVNIARTIIHDPPILVFDEPTAGLDVMVARTLTDFILELKERGKTIIFSTHIMKEAERLCDRIGIIHEGELLKRGSLSELLSVTGETDLEDAFFKLAQPEKVDL